MNSSPFNFTVSHSLHAFVFVRGEERDLNFFPCMDVRKDNSVQLCMREFLKHVQEDRSGERSLNILS